MCDKFKNKYTIESARMKGYDYSQNGLYFITICTDNRSNFFGKCVNEEMILSDIGKIAEQFWQEIPLHFPFIILDAFIAMPNHVHGILEISWNIEDKSMNENYSVKTQNFASLQPNGNYKNKFGAQSKNLSSVIRGFKAGVKKHATINNIYFNWQSRFYDRIIRNDVELNKIREYIQNNPRMWEKEKDNVENIFM